MDVDPDILPRDLSAAPCYSVTASGVLSTKCPPQTCWRPEFRRLGEPQSLTSSPPWAALKDCGNSNTPQRQLTWDPDFQSEHSWLRNHRRKPTARKTRESLWSLKGQKAWGRVSGGYLSP